MAWKSWILTEDREHHVSEIQLPEHIRSTSPAIGKLGHTVSPQLHAKGNDIDVLGCLVRYSKILFASSISIAVPG